MSKPPTDKTITDTNLSHWQSTSSVGTNSPKPSIRSFLIPLSTTLASVGLFTIVVVAAGFIFKLTMVQKWKKRRTIAEELCQAHYENMAPIYETINNAKSGDRFT